MTADPSGRQEPEFHFSKGQCVRMVEGPFTEFVGSVSESNREQKQATVLISYLSKETPFVFDFLQVEKIEPFFPSMRSIDHENDESTSVYTIRYGMRTKNPPLWRKSVRACSRHRREKQTTESRCPDAEKQTKKAKSLSGS